MKKLELRDIQLEELELLKMFVKICDKFSLKYYIVGGTLLGAIRHKGFIPWDDDIDVGMTRNEYNKFVELVKNKEISLPDNYLFSSIEFGNGFYPFIKFINKKIVINTNDSKAIDKNLWIDVFPYDGMPNDPKKAKRFLKKMFVLGHLYLVKNSSWDVIKKSHTKKAVVVKLFSKILTIFLSSDMLAKSLIKNAQKYDFRNSKYMSCSTWVGENGAFFDKELFDNTIEVKFEDTVVKTIAGYDKYLKKGYGNYMELPPENKRYTHSFDAFKLDDDE